MGYKPIENYAIIGDMHSAALVDTDGSIDWLCLPRFDSPSVFAALLDDEKGGFFQIRLSDEAQNVRSKQLYWPQSNILITRFFCDSGSMELIDYMPIGNETGPDAYRLVRQLRVMRGTVPVSISCYPAFNYAQDTHETTLNDTVVVFKSQSGYLALTSTALFQLNGTGVSVQCQLHESDTHYFAFTFTESEPVHLNPPDYESLFNKSLTFWRRWISQSTYKGRWREAVHRSAFVLKLLTYAPTGAIVAAPTTSLPEKPGGELNWDYRYTWIRDASLTVDSFLRIGLKGEGTKFIQWLNSCQVAQAKDGSFQVMYAIDGGTDVPETTVNTLKGYQNAYPVRLGNAAYKQTQLDIYGLLLNAYYLHDKYINPISYSQSWDAICKMMHWLVKNWQHPDAGLWEVRDQEKQFFFSKLMCWVAFDRALKIADSRALPCDHKLWTDTRDTLFKQIIEKGWDEKREAFTQFYGSEKLDAACLYTSLCGFLSPNDPLVIKTIETISQPIGKSGLVFDSLVYRYNDGQISGEPEEGTFNICTFWLIEVLALAGRQDPKHLDEAELLFEKMLTHGNHVGLFSEETGAKGEALGNFPQALAHLGVINAACALDNALNNRCASCADDI